MKTYKCIKSFNIYSKLENVTTKYTKGENYQIDDHMVYDNKSDNRAFINSKMLLSSFELIP